MPASTAVMAKPVQPAQQPHPPPMLEGVQEMQAARQVPQHWQQAVARALRVRLRLGMRRLPPAMLPWPTMARRKVRGPKIRVSALTSLQRSVVRRARRNRRQRRRLQPRLNERRVGVGAGAGAGGVVEVHGRSVAGGRARPLRYASQELLRLLQRLRGRNRRLRAATR